MIAAPLSGPQKCAVMVLLLDETAAASLLDRLGADEVRAVGEAMLSVAEIAPAAIEGVLAEFLDRTGAMTTLDSQGRQARALLSRALGAPRASRVIGRIGPPAAPRRFAGLDWVDPPGIAALLAGEHPQAAAVTIAHLAPERAAAVLDAMPVAARADLLVRLATLGAVDAETLDAFEADLEARVGARVEAAPIAVAGSDFAAKLINLSAFQKDMLTALGERDPALAAVIAEQLVVFADLLRIDARGMQLIVREVDTEVLAVALKGADAATRAHVFAAMSSRAAAQLQDDLAGRGPLKRDEVEAAQAQVAAVIRQLGDAGALMLPGSSGGYV